MPNLCYLCQTALEKFGWFCLVCFGFLGAGVLIHSSYSKWQESPIATTITTHPLENLDFPIVTVCPPKGSHTALHPDLIRADNASLGANEREKLRSVIQGILKNSTLDYAESMLEATNPANLEEGDEGMA